MKGHRNPGMALAAAVAILMLSASSAAAGDDPSDIVARVASWQKAFNAADMKGVAAHYTEDAKRMAYQAPTISGRSEIAANLQATRDGGAVEIVLEVTGSEAQGNLAWASGTYALMNAAGETVQKGKWLNISKKVGGKWLIHRDIWNTDAPPE